MTPVLEAAARAQAWRRHLAARAILSEATIRAGSLTIARIKHTVAVAFDVTVAELEGERRQMHLARPRQVAMYLARQHTNRSLPTIGRAFGNRDPSTVIHAARRIEALRPLDPELDAAIASIEDMLRDLGQ
jgi:chromosomal replication initiation ATPase DnaA